MYTEFNSTSPKEGLNYLNLLTLRFLGFKFRYEQNVDLNVFEGVMVSLLE